MTTPSGGFAAAARLLQRRAVVASWITLIRSAGLNSMRRRQYRVADLPERADVVDHPEAASVRGTTGRSRRCEVAHRVDRQVELQRLPVVSSSNERNVPRSVPANSSPRRTGSSFTVARRPGGSPSVIFCHDLPGRGCGTRTVRISSWWRSTLAYAVLKSKCDPSTIVNAAPGGQLRRGKLRHDAPSSTDLDHTVVVPTHSIARGPATGDRVDTPAPAVAVVGRRRRVQVRRHAGSGRVSPD